MVYRMTELLTITERLPTPVPADTSLTLPFEQRQKSRLRVRLDDGRTAGLMLSRGQILRGGDCLRGTDGSIVCIKAAAEAVSTISHDKPSELMRAAYHLGNRHVSLQVGDGWLRYLTDHVLDEMVCSLGMRISHEQAPFEPENGAYHSSAHDHGDQHQLGHAHNHEHQHGHHHAHP